MATVMMPPTVATVEQADCTTAPQLFSLVTRAAANRKRLKQSEPSLLLWQFDVRPNGLVLGALLRRPGRLDDRCGGRRRRVQPALLQLGGDHEAQAALVGDAHLVGVVGQRDQQAGQGRTAARCWVDDRHGDLLTAARAWRGWLPSGTRTSVRTRAPLGQSPGWCCGSARRAARSRRPPRPVNARSPPGR